MIGALIQGSLVVDPVERTSANGSPFWTATVRVPAGGDSILVGLGTFDRSAGERLMKLHKGSPIAAAGLLEPTVWTTREGETRSGWRLMANEVVTVHQARRMRAGERDAGA